MNRAAMWVSVLAACGTKFALPMTADQAVQYNSGPALVAYLGQPDASAEICNLRSTSTAHLHGLTADERGALVDGFKNGNISPIVWKKCVKTLESELPPEERATFLDAMLGAYKSLLDKDLETDPGRVERMSTLHKLILDRGVGVEAHPAAVATLLSEAKERIAKGKLGSIGTRFATELIETAELEHGSWHGRTIDAAILDELAAAGNEITLKRFTERLPSQELREEARRRIVRIHVALSPFPEVQHGGPELETKILAEGHNAISIVEHPVTRAYFDKHHVVSRDVIVRQHVWQQTATLVGRDAKQKVSVVPELPLRGVLMTEVAGISLPITVCAEGKELDPSPCLDVKDIAVEGKLVKLDARAVVHVVDTVWLADLLPIADRETFQIPVDVAGKPVASLAWYLRFERPENLVFSGGTGARGPDLTVRVGDMRGSRTRFDVNYGDRDFLAVVEQPDLAAFRAGSQGGADTVVATAQMDRMDRAEANAATAAMVAPVRTAATVATAATAAMSRCNSPAATEHAMRSRRRCEARSEVGVEPVAAAAEAAAAVAVAAAAAAARRPRTRIATATPSSTIRVARPDRVAPMARAARPARMVAAAHPAA